MKYCVPYSKHFKYKDKIDECMFIYNEFHNTDIFHILAENPKPYRVIIHVTDFEFFKKWRMAEAAAELKQKGVDFALMFHEYNKDMDEMLASFKEKEIQFFFETRVRDWDTFYGLINLGVSDIYIVENLGFELDLLGPVAHASSVSIRAFANVCQSSWKYGDTLKTFFIRPEDIPAYDEYVDVVEFFGNTNEQEVMYKVYALDGKWFGDLQEIIIGLDQKIDSRYVLPVFGAKRVRCGKRCMKGGMCRICDRVLEAAETFEKENVYIKK